MLLTKGPFALFFGCEEIILHLSSDSATSPNASIFILVAVSVLLHIFLSVYKVFKFRIEIHQEQQLNHVMMSGFRNVFGQSMIVLHFFAISIMLCIHMYLSNQVKTSQSIPIGKALILAFIMCYVVFHYFVRNNIKM